MTMTPAHQQTNQSDTVESPSDSEPGAQSIGVHYDTQLPKLPWSRQIQIPLIAALVYTVIRILGPTLRFEVLGWQNAENVYASGRRVIWAFWHRVIIPVVWWRRNCGVVVMNTTAFDGQWTRKVIEWMGYGTAQGSSSRGGLRGLAVMARRIEEGRDCAFTIDGPRGPRYVAKPGPVMLARRSGAPVVVFHIGVERGETFEKTWDHFLLPRPFTKTIMIFAPPIEVPPDADAALLEAKHAEMQKELERVRDIAEGWFGLREAERNAHRAAIGD
ncbi:MAG TPA: lysophospholipid acyltransferase family protein [Candidatus Acidoferrum sp.]|nr:lysophospholipid acyltransferase family protein [Candidatus Acidoferrum sp.]